MPSPTNALDRVVVALIGAGGAMMLMGNIVILWNRGYTPIKTKSVTLTLLSSIGGLIWIVAAIVVNEHFERRNHSLMSVCVLWTYWLQACFGFALWLNCLTLRLITLYRIFICKRNAGTYDYPLLILLLLPAIAICIEASVNKHQIKFIPAPAPAKPPRHHAVGTCQFEKNAPWAYGLIVLLVIYFLTFLGFSFKLRNAMAQYNEFRLIRRGGILSLFLFLLSLVTLNSHAYFKSVGRCLLSGAVASAIFYYFWARNGVVIYNVLFNREEYLDQFNAELRRVPIQHEREKSTAAILKMEDQLREVRAEVQNYQESIKQLEDEVKGLELEYSAMQQKTSSQSSPNTREISLV